MAVEATPIDWQEIERGLIAAIRAASRFDDGHVIWVAQGGTRPDFPYITLNLGALIPLGATDEITTEYDETAEDGQEIITTVSGFREFSLSIQAYSNDVIGNNSARAILNATQRRLALPSVRDTFQPLGLALFDRGEVVPLDQNLGGAEFFGRASLDVRFYVTDAESERGTYVEKVIGTGTVSGGKLAPVAIDLEADGS